MIGSMTPSSAVPDPKSRGYCSGGDEETTQNLMFAQYALRSPHTNPADPQSTLETCETKDSSVVMFSMLILFQPAAIPTYASL